MLCPPFLFFRSSHALFLGGDIKEGNKGRQKNSRPAVLVGSDLCNNLRCNIASRREGMRLFDKGTRNDGSVLEHVLQIDQIAVVHMLRKIVRVVEMNKPLVVRFDDVFGEQNTAGNIFADFPCHIVALNGIDSRIFIGIFLFDFFVVAFNQSQNLRVRRICTANELTGITIGNIFTGNGIRLLIHDLIFDKVLNLLHADRAVEIARKRGDFLRNILDLLFAQTVVLADFVVCLGDRVYDLRQIERNFGTVSLDDFHLTISPFLSFRLLTIKASP